MEIAPLLDWRRISAVGRWCATTQSGAHLHCTNDLTAREIHWISICPASTVGLFNPPGVETVSDFPMAHCNTFQKYLYYQTVSHSPPVVSRLQRV
jgi:hypothetical protein